MGAALDVIRHIDYVTEAVAMAPVVAARMSNEGVSSRYFLYVINRDVAGLSTPYTVPLDAPHIRKRAKANRIRNRQARIARRYNRVP